MSKKVKIGIIVVLIMGAIGGIFELLGIGPEEKEVSKDPVEKEEVVAEKTIDEKIKESIYEAVGSTYRKKDSIDDLSVADAEEGKNIRVIMKRDQVNKNTLLRHTQDIMEELDKLDEVVYVNVEWQTELFDSYGNGEYVPVLRIDMTKETLNKIDWNNFNYQNISKVADDYWEHQALR